MTPVADRIAAEVFVQMMHRWRIRPLDMATQCHSEFIEREGTQGPAARYEIVRHFRPSSPFWPLTVSGDGTAGFGITCEARCIHYQRRSFRAASHVFGFIAERVDFGPGCQRLAGAGPSQTVVVCEIVPPQQAVRVIKRYLIDATLSLINGHGPLKADSVESR